ncbi:MAG: hypothetical protein GXO95_01910 [Nitrospirae bacterium]|nr:hypothetical protein [Nitrospirota bacterium]
MNTITLIAQSVASLLISSREEMTEDYLQSLLVDAINDLSIEYLRYIHKDEWKWINTDRDSRQIRKIKAIVYHKLRLMNPDAFAYLNSEINIRYWEELFEEGMESWHSRYIRENDFFPVKKTWFKWRDELVGKRLGLPVDRESVSRRSLEVKEKAVEITNNFNKISPWQELALSYARDVEAGQRQWTCKQKFLFNITETHNIWDRFKQSWNDKRNFVYPDPQAMGWLPEGTRVIAHMSRGPQDLHCYVVDFYGNLEPDHDRLWNAAKRFKEQWDRWGFDTLDRPVWIEIGFKGCRGLSPE